MKYNHDGSPLALETIEDLINERFDESENASVSDLLGSDWGLNKSVFRTEREKAHETARRLYVYSWNK